MVILFANFCEMFFMFVIFHNLVMMGFLFQRSTVLRDFGIGCKVLGCFILQQTFFMSNLHLAHQMSNKMPHSSLIKFHGMCFMVLIVLGH